MAFYRKLGGQRKWRKNKRPIWVVLCSFIWHFIESIKRTHPFSTSTKIPSLATCCSFDVAFRFLNIPMLLVPMAFFQTISEHKSTQFSVLLFISLQFHFIFLSFPFISVRFFSLSGYFLSYPLLFLSFSSHFLLYSSIFLLVPYMFLLCC